MRVRGHAPELLYSARSQTDYRQLETDLAEFRDLRMNAETSASRSAPSASSRRAASTASRYPDLLIAACAQQHGADVLHVDRHFEVLASVLSFGARRSCHVSRGAGV